MFIKVLFNFLKFFWQFFTILELFSILILVFKFPTLFFFNLLVHFDFFVLLLWFFYTILVIFSHFLQFLVPFCNFCGLLNFWIFLIISTFWINCIFMFLVLFYTLLKIVFPLRFRIESGCIRIELIYRLIDIWYFFAFLIFNPFLHFRYYFLLLIMIFGTFFIICTFPSLLKHVFQ